MKKRVMGAVMTVLLSGMTLPAAAQWDSKPDLIVKKIQASGAAVFAGESIILPVTLRIENAGRKDAGPFRVAIMKALVAPVGAEREVEFSAKTPTTRLKAGGSLDINGKITIAHRSEAGRNVRIRALVDSQNQVDESNEGNNLSSRLEVRLPVELVPAGTALKPLPVRGLPDLTLTEEDITVTPPTPLAGSGPDIRVDIVVRNAGPAEARDVAVNLALLDASRRSVAFRTMSIASIAGRAAQRTTTVLGNSLFGRGDHRLLVEIDRNGNVEESREDNNATEKSLTVLGPEFSISLAEVEISPPSPRTGDAFSLVIPVRNNGDGDAMNVEVHWEIVDHAGRVVLEGPERGIVMDRIPAHGFNVRTIRRLSFDSGREGDYALRIVVDPRNRFIEKDKGDNAAEKIFEVTR